MTDNKLTAEEQLRALEIARGVSQDFSAATFEPCLRAAIEAVVQARAQPGVEVVVTVLFANQLKVIEWISRLLDEQKLFDRAKSQREFMKTGAPAFEVTNGSVIRLKTIYDIGNARYHNS